jgi:hypothetical protein
MITKLFNFTFMLSISSFIVILYKFIIRDYSIYMLTYTKEAGVFVLFCILLGLLCLYWTFSQIVFTIIKKYFPRFLTENVKTITSIGLVGIMLNNLLILHYYLSREANIFGELLKTKYFIIYKNFTEIEKLQWLNELNLYLQVNHDLWLTLTKKVDLSTLRCYNDLLLSVRDNLNDQLQIMTTKVNLFDSEISVLTTPTVISTAFEKYGIYLFMGGTVIVVSLVAYTQFEVITNIVKAMTNYVKNYGFNNLWVHFSQYLKQNDALCAFLLICTIMQNN